jgi:hypothetical protein
MVILFYLSSSSPPWWAVSYSCLLLFKILSFLLKSHGLRFPAQYSRDSYVQYFFFKKKCSANGASAAGVVCRDVDIYGTKRILLIVFYFEGKCKGEVFLVLN